MLCSNSQFIIITKVVGGGSSYRMLMGKYWGADKSLAQPGKKQATATGFLVSYTVFIIIIGGMLVLYIYIYIYIYINKTSIKWNILTIKQNTSGSRSG